MRSPDTRLVSLQRRGERGSALLIVLVFAAIIAIMLYREMPIAAFEAQRQKEALLVSRGNEYKRGVKLFVRKVGRFPSSLNELESTNRMRFLRHRYVDPLTGKDDWRLIHAGPGGTIIDSKVQTKNGKADNALGQGAKFGGFNNSFTGDVDAIKDAEPVSAALRQRPAATQNAATAGTPGGPGTDAFALPQGAAALAPQDPNGAAPSPVEMAQLQRAAQAQGQSNNGQQDPNQPGVNPQNPATPVFNRQLPFDPATGQAYGQGQGNAAASPAGGPPDPNSTPTQQQSSSPANLSQQLATQNPNAQEQSPAQQRAAGFAGAPANIAQGIGAAGNGQIMAAGGIAGVASKAAGKSIKAVNEQTKYSLWEFYYDMRKEQNAGAAGALGGRQNSNNSDQQQMQGGFNGQSTGSGQSSGFGQSQSGSGVTAPPPSQTPSPLAQQ